MRYIRINIIDKKYQPGLNMLGSMNKLQFMDEFTEYVAKEMQKELVKAIDTQRFIHKWEPLSVPYLKYKKKHHLSLKTWESTGLLKNSIKVYKYGNVYQVGIDKRRRYKGTNIRIYDVAVWLEYGTSTMPARPLFRPLVNYMTKNIRTYWNRFLKEKGVKL